MNQFTATINNPVEARTDNGMKALNRTGNALVDLFFKAGAMRGKDATPQFVTAYQEDALLATKLMFWLRDIRSGAGERQQFRNFLKWLSNNHPQVVRENIDLIAFYGRWDDLLVIEHPKVRKEAMEFWAVALRSGDKLAAKWVPRDEKKNKSIRECIGMTPRNFRKFVSDLSETVESLMCAKKWNEIEFAHVPSVASARYQKAFGRNAQEKYAKYLDALQNGETKINASSIFPYDVIHSMRRGNRAVAIEQWKALPNYMTDKNVLAMVDVSGSMDKRLNRENYNGPTIMDVAISLGLYAADKMTGAFKDTFLTFSGSPELLHLKGNIGAKLDQMENSTWAMNTNLNAAFEKILSHAVRNNVPAADMPEMLVILSDMQFDACVCHDDSAIEMIRRKYETAGYKAPMVVFWNLNAGSNVPVKFNESGVALVSGFSPSIFKALLAADVDAFSPEGIMLQTLTSERYARVVV